MKLLINIAKYVGLMGLAIISNIIPIVLLKNQDKLTEPMKWGVGILYLLFIVIIIPVLWKFYKRHETAEVAAQKMTLKDVGINFLYYLLGRFVAIAGSIILTYLSGQTSTANDAALKEITNLFSNGFLFFPILYCCMIGIAGPIMEELAFRGFPQKLLFKGQNKLLAGLVTSFIFALGHVSSPIELLVYFPLGVVLYLAYQRRGNLKDSIMVHIFNNIPTAILFLLIALGVVK